LISVLYRFRISMSDELRTFSALAGSGGFW